MKKLAILACMMGMVVTAAFGSSLGIPWFVDNSPAGAGVPPTSGNLTLIFLHNNNSDTIMAAISYYNALGIPQGTDSNKSTFTIAGNASIAFRPVALDPSGAAVAALGLPGTGAGGQEEVAGYLVPNRGNLDGRKNGSAVIQWVGPATMIQGALVQYGVTTSLGYLLPPGA